jgi:hypothetical protein
LCYRPISFSAKYLVKEKVLSDEFSFSEQILEAISSVIVDSGASAIVSGFLLVTQIIAEDGDTQVLVTHPDNQGMPASLGLCGFAEEWIRDDMRRTFEAIE